MSERDASIALAISMAAGPGVYALLLGAGISMNSGIPTGWHIQQDLLKSLAGRREEPIPSDLDQWYRDTFHRDPTYSSLLADVTTSPAERSRVIARYIEPSEEERETGDKQPTDAHIAIADLVASGFIRVIVTTNFDRLLENALRQAGVEPVVISSVAAILRVPPLVHNRCTVIKIHGDYQEVATLNTAAELQSYPDPFSELLRQVIREYGLVISGWSAEHDHALRALISESPAQRLYPTYWSTGPSGSLRGRAQELASELGAQVIRADGADAFFSELRDSVMSIRDFGAAQSANPDLSVTRMKRYIADPVHRVRSRELLVRETQRLLDAIRLEPLGYMANMDAVTVAARLERYEQSSVTLRSLAAVAGYYGGEGQVAEWSECLERLLTIHPPERQVGGWAELERYPAVLTFYTLGIAAVAAQNYQLLVALSNSGEIEPRYAGGPWSPALPLLRADAVLADGTLGVLPQYAQRYHRRLLYFRFQPGLWKPLDPFISSQDRLLRVTDRFEYLFGLMITDQRLQGLHRDWASLGGFMTRGHLGDLPGIAETIDGEIAANGRNWAPLRVGMFGGEQERLLAALLQYKNEIISARGMFLGPGWG